ncbi:MAG: hypothetical protein A4E64_03194 [Syntrophorhabdus sp. PtaU1.Bin058]|nr:MAG: hypothetical protein A4E64_03194 [Syntrophorhabdus sp. PtaU1.Bin058]
MAVRCAWLKYLILLFPLAVFATGCASVRQQVDLTYGRFVNAAGGSGELFIARPAAQYSAAPFQAGRTVLGKTGEEEIFTGNDPVDWFLSALVEELSAAGYKVKTCTELPDRVSKGVKPAIVGLSANQSSNALTISTVAQVRLEAQVFKDGRLTKTLTSGARDEDEGMDRSAEPIRWALEKTLQHAMQGLVPDIVKSLE